MEIKAIRNGNDVELDVRTIQEKKEEPFYVIMETVDSLDNNEQFILHSRINPVPLLGVMEGKGFQNKVEQIEENHWKISFFKGN